MKNQYKTITILVLIIILPLGLLSQDHFLNKANKLYKLQKYSMAIEYYSQYLGSVQDVIAMSKLADCYRLTNKSVEAERLYQVVVKSKEAMPIHYFHFANVLKMNEKYDEAEIWFREYIKANPNDKEARGYMKTCQEIDKFLSVDSVNYKVYNLNINTPFSYFGAIFYKEGIVYASARDDHSKTKRRFGWTNESFLDLYYSHEGFEDKFRQPVLFSDKLNSRYHEGVVTFPENQTTIYFTRNNYLKGKTQKSSLGVNKLNIYISNYKDDQWTEPKLFEINNFEYSIGQPTISKDGKVMYFISDMPGGYGGTDIYACQNLGYRWTKPSNLGANVNTSGNEMFPFFHEDGSLYFSSDGHPGLGGLDIFVTRYNGFKWEVPSNLKPPFCSPKDDFSYIINDDRTFGFFSSNRDGGKGGDDIYYFEKNIEMLRNLKGIVISALTKEPIHKVDIVLQDYINPDNIFSTDTSGLFDFSIEHGQNYTIVLSKSGYHTKSVLYFESEYKDIKEPYLEIELEEAMWFKLEGTITDAELNEPMAGVNVELVNQTYSISTRLASEEDGKFYFDLDPESNYIVVFSKDGYFTESIQDLSTFGKVESEIIYYDIVLGMRKMVVDRAVELKNIYYSLNKWNLTAKSKLECDKLVTILRDNPHIKIELSSHTDSRASDEYNIELSQKRANTVVEYVISKGIQKSRIVPKGYGETQLKNRCRNGIPCPESLHQQNRRTEFKVIGN